MINRAISRAFKKARERKWSKLYVAVDLHDTIVVGNYSKEVAMTFMGSSLECLQYLSTRPDIALIVYSCTHDADLKRYKEFFEENGIFFQYFNENPAIATEPHGLGNYERKMYFDILFEDKAGFDPETEWDIAIETFKFQPILKVTV